MLTTSFDLTDDGARDAGLVKRVAAGDAEGFTELFRRRRGDIYRFAMHMTATASAAEDITQEVFLTVMREAGRYDAGRASVLAWLYGITRNHVRRWLDANRVPAFDGARTYEPVAADDPHSDLCQAERVAALRQAVLRLPSRYREAIVLCDIQELSYQDAAAALGCALGTVRSRLHRGRALITAALRRDAGPARRLKASRSRCFA